MTREEAIEYLTILGGIGGITDNEAVALEIAIKAIEQEPILDKIRAEIIEYEGDCRLSVDEYPSCKQREFSGEFQNNLLDLFEMFYKNHTDSCTVTFEYPNEVMEVDFTFRAAREDKE